MNPPIILVTLNSITNALVLLWLLNRLASRLEFRIARTLFQEKPYGFSVTLWKYARHSGCNTGKGRGFSWINLDRLVDKPYGERNASILSAVREALRHA